MRKKNVISDVEKNKRETIVGLEKIEHLYFNETFSDCLPSLDKQKRHRFFFPFIWLSSDVN